MRNNLDLRFWMHIALRLSSDSDRNRLFLSAKKRGGWSYSSWLVWFNSILLELDVATISTRSRLRFRRPKDFEWLELEMTGRNQYQIRHMTRSRNRFDRNILGRLWKDGQRTSREVSVTSCLSDATMVFTMKGITSTIRMKIELTRPSTIRRHFETNTWLCSRTFGRRRLSTNPEENPTHGNLVQFSGLRDLTGFIQLTTETHCEVEKPNLEIKLCNFI